MPRPLASTGVLSRLALAVVLSLLGGVLLAGLAVPLVGGAGFAAKATADDFLALPTALETPALSTRSRVLAADGSLLATFYRVNRVSVPLSAIPVTMRRAIVAIEDSRFYEHKGVDYKGTARAALTNLKAGGVAQGGSTLTQQYVKNALIEAANGNKAGLEAARGISAERKLREARYALTLERRLPKDEILRRYLDIAYFGNGVYGIGTAATYYFNTSVSKLTLAQSATLAGVVQNPTRYNIASRDASVRRDVVERRNIVLGRMADLGYISASTRAKTAASKLPRITPQKVGQDCGAAGVRAPFFCQYVRHELEATDIGAALGATREQRQAALLGGGLTIKTSLDPRIQRAAQQAVDDKVPADDPSEVYAAINMVEPGTGHIRAMAVDRPYGENTKKGQTQVNFATGGTFGGYQPGSTFKPFFLAAALQEGVPLSTSFDSPAIYYPKAFKYEESPGKPIPVRNSEDEEAGVFDLVSGTHASVNTFYMQLAEQIGLEKPLALAESLGLKQVEYGKQSPLPRLPSTVLGSATVNPLAMVGAYATFAARGKHCTPQAVVSVTGPDGKALDIPAPRCGQAMDAGIADTVTSVLRGVIDGDDPFRTGRRASIGRPVAGKTGTTDSSRAAWFVGYTPQLATAVWVGKKNPTPLRRIVINGSYYKQVFGGSVPASIFSQAMGEAHKGLPVQQFEAPDASVVQGRGGTVPEVAGLSYDTAASVLRSAGFRPTAGRHVPSSRPAEVVTYTYPASGATPSPGATVYIYRSNGSSSYFPSAGGTGSGTGTGSGSSNGNGNGSSNGNGSGRNPR